MAFYTQLHDFAEKKPYVLKAYILLALATELATPRTMRRLHQDLWYDDIDIVKRQIEMATNKRKLAQLQKELGGYELICKTIREIDPDYAIPG